MKKLYIKQQLFSGIDKFSVKDEEERDCYLVEGDFVQIGGKKLHIKNMDGEELATLKQKLVSLRPKFLVFVNGEQTAAIVKKFALFGSKYLIEGPNWQVKGSIMGHDYIISAGSEEIVKLHKAWLSWGDSYELDISDSADETLALAVVLAIDCVLEAEAEAAANTD